MFIAEVVETRKAFSPDQKDFNNNPLPIGSIEVRLMGDQSQLSQVRNVYCRPATFNKRIPLIGEHVLVFLAPAIEWSTDGTKTHAFLYFCPYNATDDLVLHQFPKLWKRSGFSSKPSPERKSDKKEPGYTFPKIPRKTYMLQPYEGDDLWEGRFGHSIRFGTTVSGDMSIYQNKKTPWQGGQNTDPIIAIRNKKPTQAGSGGNTGDQTGAKYSKKEKYVLENIGTDESSIYMTSTQKLPDLKMGSSKNSDAKGAPNWSGGSQIVVNADRLVLNARKDNAMLVGNSKAIVTGKKVILQSDKFYVDLDDLMEYIKDWIGQDTQLAQGSAQYSTACGPSSVSTNVSEYVQLNTTKWMKFKK